MSSLLNFVREGIEVIDFLLGFMLGIVVTRYLVFYAAIEHRKYQQQIKNVLDENPKLKEFYQRKGEI